MEKKLNDVFTHNLHQMYFGEKALVSALQHLSERAKDPTIKEDLTAHKKETMGHVRNLEKVFELAGMVRDEMKSKMWEIAEEELSSMLKIVESDSKDFFILETAAKAERLEISYYESLILSCKDIELDNKGEILDLLRANLADEEAALAKAIDGMKKQVSFWKRAIH